MEIRQMMSGDWSAVKRIYDEAISTGESTLDVESPSVEVWNKTYENKCRLVLCVDKLVVGWSAVSIEKQKSISKGTVSIYLDNSYQGEGYGTMLLKKLCEESAANGFYNLYSTIISTNLASIHMHEKCGFKRIAYKANAGYNKFGIMKDLVILRKKTKLL